MTSLLFFSLWGFQGSLALALETAECGGFDGLELNIRHPCLLADAEGPARLRDSGRPLVLEVVTGGGYVPELGCTAEQHLAELDALLRGCVGLRPHRVTVLTGSDAWPLERQRSFLAEALALAEATGLAVSFETHRSRCLGMPWTIGPLLDALPGLRLTADLSHWCVVAERLMTPELEPVQAMADRVDHIHARVGHAQGPQVSHPFAPEHGEALAAHLACWQLFSERALKRGAPPPSFTPEFGPDGYMPTLPFTNQPVADLLTINTAMAGWLRRLFPAAAGDRIGSQ
ncbi:MULTISPECIES: sugar phosphate isomerase/epimerase [unclassified Cyanobium]|uniref:sugar phosphate isomerase/epimerase n=1 Tax=unclassified Cyanobium TaxID=2627006 RepID=UPI0020CC813D|nr:MULTISPECIES: sugar phosphate isomerase/epimerase [unclassified Cyanobium]MCP9835226.1 sugar phosphate isomerase/epimerase [Cyanobium sp. La Preciosa 7G6]MCP9937991.1 sugar phosphate isomerase/epimerase [Cyanobium sp. Aljojuca 7A6]